MPSPQSFLPLTVPVFHILLALTDEARHGYAILQEIERRTGGGVRLGTGTLYTAIKRLVASELIEGVEAPEDADSDDERRRYYAITELGRRVARAEAERMNELIVLARQKSVL